MSVVLPPTFVRSYVQLSAIIAPLVLAAACSLASDATAAVAGFPARWVDGEPTTVTNGAGCAADQPLDEPVAAVRFGVSLRLHRLVEANNGRWRCIGGANACGSTRRYDWSDCDRPSRFSSGPAPLAVGLETVRLQI